MKNKVLIPTIIYTLNEPEVWNKGTKYEVKRDTFLYRYYRNFPAEELQKEVDRLNATATDRVYKISAQEEMY